MKMGMSTDKLRIRNMTDREIKIKLGLITIPPYWMAIANKIKDPKARQKYIERMEKDV